MSLSVPTRRIRILVQAGVFALWVALIYVTRHPLDSWLANHIPVNFLLRLDPLVMTVVCGGMRMAVTITLLAAVTFVVSVLLGRVFCGWICPLGSLFDAYAWVLRHLRVPIEGKSPRWFTLKYYLLFAILVLAAFGAVSPLMGLDPIVLLTRVAATVVNPFLRESDKLFWTVSEAPGNYGYFFDGATLLLFIGIMVGTTRLSRIWCRTTCPLGAYLAVLSRHSVLRRDTEGCIHCNICAVHCPTGAIDFTDERVYNESECIKCFLCSTECPVDANFFTIKSPIPATTPSQYPVSLQRRTLFTTLLATLFSAPLVLRSAGKPGSSKKLIRPPMSREERDFLASCIRCTECVKACPTGILKSAGLEHGIRALWSPVMVSSEGYCQEGCHACSEACPTDAIMKYPLEQKYAYKAGTAVFESNRCISYTENKFCNECVKACPTDAISVLKGWEPPGSQGADFPAPSGLVPTRPLRVVYERCVGCGACEYECNKIVFGDPAMKNTSQGRAVPTALDVVMRGNKESVWVF
ncbi:MAG: 4Fe-4S binding protein [Bdellovibrionaceae bacterium]|nr:4Fe-4S binding protein [Pseudobdellovibrionaceae bacterium]